MSEIPIAEQQNPEEVGLAQATLEAEQTFIQWQEQATTADLPDGRQVTQIGGVNRFSSVAYKFLRMYEAKGQPTEYEYSEVGHHDLKTEYIARWIEGGTTVRRGTKSALDQQNEDYPAFDDELPASEKLVASLTQKVKDVGGMLRSDAIEGAQARAQAAESAARPTGRIAQAISRLGLSRRR